MSLWLRQLPRGRCLRSVPRLTSREPGVLPGAEDVLRCCVSRCDWSPIVLRNARHVHRPSECMLLDTADHLLSAEQYQGLEQLELAEAAQEAVAALQNPTAAAGVQVAGSSRRPDEATTEKDGQAAYRRVGQEAGVWQPKRRISRSDMRKIQLLREKVSKSLSMAFSANGCLYDVLSAELMCRQVPDRYTIDKLSFIFGVSQSAVRRIVRSKWRPPLEVVARQATQPNRREVFGDVAMVAPPAAPNPHSYLGRGAAGATGDTHTALEPAKGNTKAQIKDHPGSSGQSHRQIAAKASTTDPLRAIESK